MSAAVELASGALAIAETVLYFGPYESRYAELALEG